MLEHPYVFWLGTGVDVVVRGGGGVGGTGEPVGGIFM